MPLPSILLRTQGVQRPSLRLSTNAEEKAGAPALKRILIVDDDRRVRMITARMLRQEGYEVVEAGSGQEALQVLERGAVHLVVTDVVMPEMDGITLASRLVLEDPLRRIILISGYASEHLTRLGVESSPYPLLMKPFTPEQLVQVVERELRRISPH